MSNNKGTDPVSNHDDPMYDPRDEIIAQLTAKKAKLEAKQAKLTELLAREKQQTKQLIAEIKQTMGEGEETQAYMENRYMESVQRKERMMQREITEAEKQELYKVYMGSE